MLLNPKQRQNQGLTGVREIAEAMGFSGRSYVTDRYEQNFLELARETLKRSHLAHLYR